MDLLNHITNFVVEVIARVRQGIIRMCRLEISNYKGFVTFQVPIMFGLEILLTGFLTAILNWNFRLRTSNFRDQKSPLSICTFL